MSAIVFTIVLLVGSSPNNPTAASSVPHTPSSTVEAPQSTNATSGSEAQSEPAASDASSQNTSATTESVSQNANNEPNDSFIFHCCRAHGLSNAAAAAIVGNCMVESGCDPTCATSYGYGIANWSYLGLCELQEYAAERGTDWTDLDTQVCKIINDLSDDSPDGVFALYTGWTGQYETGAIYGWPSVVTFDQWRQWTDVTNATQCFEQVYERAGTSNMANRIQRAQEAYCQYRS